MMDELGLFFLGGSMGMDNRWHSFFFLLYTQPVFCSVFRGGLRIRMYDYFCVHVL